MSSAAKLPQPPFVYSSLNDEEAPEEVGSTQQTSSDEEASVEASWSRRHVVVAATGAASALLLLCALTQLLSSVGFAALSPGRASSSALSAAEPLEAAMTPRQLLDSDRFADVAADNAMAIAQGSVHPGLRPEIRDGFRAGFRNISARLWTSHPEAGVQLDAIQLTPVEQAAFLKMMRSASDPRVLRLGRDVGLHVHRGVGEAHRGRSGDDADVKQHVADSLGSDLVSIRQLREEVIPEAIRGPEDLTGEDDDVSLSVGHEGISLMRTLDHWNLELDFAAPQVGAAGKLPPSERRLSSSGSSLSGESMIELMKMEAQVEKYINQVQEFAATKYNVHIPNMQEALRGIDMTDAMECAMSAAMTADPATLLKCGMEFWEMAMEVMQNIAHGIGPVTTTTEKVVFQSFADMMD